MYRRWLWFFTLSKQEHFRVWSGGGGICFFSPPFFLSSLSLLLSFSKYVPRLVLMIDWYFAFPGRPTEIVHLNRPWHETVRRMRWLTRCDVGATLKKKKKKEKQNSNKKSCYRISIMWCDKAKEDFPRRTPRGVTHFSNSLDGLWETKGQRGRRRRRKRLILIFSCWSYSRSRKQCNTSSLPAAALMHVVPAADTLHLSTAAASKIKSQRPSAAIWA